MGAGRRRAQAGSQAEAAIGPTIAVYRDYRWRGRWSRRRPGEPGSALLVRQHPPTVGPQGRRSLVAKGATDYFGVARAPDGGLVPVAFDVKGFRGAGHASFSMPEAQRHQLGFMQEVLDLGGLAFVLLVDDRAGVAWVLARHEDLLALQAGEAVRVCSRRAGVPVESALPSVRRERLGHLPFLGYDFLSLFPSVRPNG